MTVPLPKPDTAADFYLLAILDELRGIRELLTPAEPEPATAKPRTRKATA